MFSWKGESLKESWDCILNVLKYPEDNCKGRIPDLIVDDGFEMTVLIHEGMRVEYLLLKDGNIPEPSSTDNVEFNIVQTKKIANTCMGVSEETSTGVHHLYTMENTGTNHQN